MGIRGVDWRDIFITPIALPNLLNFKCDWVFIFRRHKVWMHPDHRRVSVPPSYSNILPSSHVCNPFPVTPWSFPSDSVAQIIIVVPQTCTIRTNLRIRYSNFFLFVQSKCTQIPIKISRKIFIFAKRKFTQKMYLRWKAQICNIITKLSKTKKLGHFEPRISFRHRE